MPRRFILPVLGVVVTAGLACGRVETAEREDPAGESSDLSLHSGSGGSLVQPAAGGAASGAEGEGGLPRTDEEPPPRAPVARVVFVLQPYGFLAGAFRPAALPPPQPIHEAEVFSLDEATLSTSPVLAPLSVFAEQVFLLDEFSVLVSTFTSIATPEELRLLIARSIHGTDQVVGPSFDTMLAAHLGGRVSEPLVGPHSGGLSFDSNGQSIRSTEAPALAARLAQNSRCKALKPGASAEGSWEMWRSVSSMIAEELACGDTRVVTILAPAPIPDELQLPDSVDFHQNYADRWEFPEEEKVLAQYSQQAGERVAELIAALAARRDAHGSLLDQTLVVFTGLVAHPGHRTSPLQIALIGGRALGFGPARYARMPPFLVADTPAGYGPEPFGPPHQMVWTSIGHQLGLSDLIGDQELTAAFLPAPLDLSGGIPGISLGNK